MAVPNGLAAAALLLKGDELAGGIPKGDGLGAATPNGDGLLLNGVGAGAMPNGDGAVDCCGCIGLPKALAGDGAWPPKAPPKGEVPGAADPNGLDASEALVVVDCCGFPNGEGPVDPPPNGLVFELGAPKEVGAAALDPNGVELPKELVKLLPPVTPPPSPPNVVAGAPVELNGFDSDCMFPNVDCGVAFPNGEEFPNGELLLVFMDPLPPKGDWVEAALPKDDDPCAAATSCEKLHRLPLLHLPCRKKVHNLLPLLSVAGRSVVLLLLLLLEAPKLVLLLLLLLLFQGEVNVPELSIACPG